MYSSNLGHQGSLLVVRDEATQSVDEANRWAADREHRSHEIFLFVCCQGNTKGYCVSEPGCIMDGEQSGFVTSQHCFMSF